MKLREKAASHNNVFMQITSPVNQDTSEEKYNKLSKVIKFITKVTNPFADNPESYNDVIFLMGPTGAGKSTLTNYLAGKKLYYQLHNNMPGIFPAEGDSIAFVGQGAGSTTLAPNMWRDNTGVFGGAVFIDCAGESDTGGIIIDIINEKIKSTIAHNINKAKILLVTSQDSIGPAGSYGLSFKQGLEKSAQFLNDINHFQNSMGFVVTHAGRNRTTENTVKSYLQSVIANQALDKYKILLQDIVNRGLLETFSKYSDDDDVGDEYTSPGWNPNQRDALIELITRIDFREVPKDFFNLSSSPEIRERMSIAFKLVEEKATGLLKESFKTAVAEKVVIQCLRLKSFVEFFERDLIEQSKGLNLFQYIKLINDHNFIKLVEPDGIKQLGSDMEFLWPYTQNLEQQQSQPFINWNSYINYQFLLGELIQEAKTILFGTENIFEAFHEGNRIITKGCFSLSSDIKAKFGVFAGACQSKQNVEHSKTDAKYYYNVTEQKFVGMKKEPYTVSKPYTVYKDYTVNEPYTAKENYIEIVDKLVDVEVPYKEYKTVVMTGGRDAVTPKGFYLLRIDLVRKPGTFTSSKRNWVFQKDCIKIEQKYVKEEVTREKEVIKYQTVTKQNAVIEYQNVTEYKDVPCYESVLVKKFDETKYNTDVKNATQRVGTAVSDIEGCISRLETINAQIKSTLPSNKAFEVESNAKVESDLCRLKNTASHVTQDFTNLQEEWKYLEHEAKVLGEVCFELGIEANFAV